MSMQDRMQDRSRYEAAKAEQLERLGRPEPERANPIEHLDADEIPQDRIDVLADWLHGRNIGICEMDDDIVYNDLKSMRSLAEALLQHGPDGIRITRPERGGRPGDQPDTCWLCKGLGGVALHMKWSEARGEALFTAHLPVSRSHPVHVCPACELADKDAEIARSQASLKLIAGRYKEEIDWRLKAEHDRDAARSALEEALGQLDIIRFALGVPSGGGPDA